MKIAIHAADLDADRIDGTRVYIKNVLNNFGKIDQESEFMIYHKNTFNPELKPLNFSNYTIEKKPDCFLWTQTRFTQSLRREKPDVVWMPVHNSPFFMPKKTRLVVTIHDLAFKRFPNYFLRDDLYKITLLTKMAVSRADEIITVSEFTKYDLLKYYPESQRKKIHVVHHGFEKTVFDTEYSQEEKKNILEKYGLSEKKYLLYVGAIQPRKNLITLIDAYEQFKDKNKTEQKLVIAGEKAWMWEEIITRVNRSRYRNQIIITGTIPFAEVALLYRNAELFIFPSLYEGFGIPILEAFASGVPVLAAANSSLLEIASDAALYFEGANAQHLAKKILMIINNTDIQADMIKRGKNRAKQFSWERCTKETLEILKCKN